MIRKTFIHAMLGASAVLAASGTALADTVPDIRITEFMYKGEGSPGEFVEFTNLGTTAVDMTGWSEDDSTRTPNKSGHSLSAFGVVQSGQSVIFTEASPDAFRAAWGLSDSVKVIGPYSNDNLGNGDEINLYDNHSNLIDRLTYASDPRTDGVSAVPTSASVIGANNISGWVLSQNGVNGAYAALGGDIGSPGYSSFAPVPLPAAAWLLLSGFGAFGLRRRKDVAA
jgi:predicted extracellular nuclease